MGGVFTVLLWSVTAVSGAWNERSFQAPFSWCTRTQWYSLASQTGTEVNVPSALQLAVGFPTSAWPLLHEYATSCVNLTAVLSAVPLAIAGTLQYTAVQRLGKKCNGRNKLTRWQSHLSDSASWMLKVKNCIAALSVNTY